MPKVKLPLHIKFSPYLKNLCKVPTMNHIAICATVQFLVDSH